MGDGCRAGCRQARVANKASSSLGQSYNKVLMKKPFNPQSPCYRYSILLLIAGVQLFMNIALIVPSALEGILISTLKIDVTHYGLLSSLYSWPTVFLTVIGAIVVNKYLGCRLATVLFMTTLCIGQSIFTIGGFFGVFWLLLVSRVIVGIAGVMIFTTCDVFAARWFKGHEVSVAFGVVGTFCRIGSAGGLYLNSFVYDSLHSIHNKNSRLGVALLFSVIMLLIGTVLSLILAWMDKYAEKVDIKIKKSSEKLDGSKFSVKEIFNFNVNFWMMSFICFLFLCTYFPFVAFGQVFLVSKYGLSIDTANATNLLIFLVPIIAPLFGALITWTGYNITWSLGGVLIAFASHLTYLLSNGEWFIPFIANFTLGLSYSCVNTALWSTPPLLVKDHQLVTAYSVLEAGLNLGFAVTGVVSGPLIDNCGYFAHQLFFISLLVMATFITIVLIINLIGSKWDANKSGSCQKKPRTVEEDANSNFVNL